MTVADQLARIGWARDQAAINASTLAVLEQLAHAAELQDDMLDSLRDELRALSNRVESLTRAMNERGHLHSVRVDR